MSQKNTLFNYFGKSPGSKSSPVLQKTPSTPGRQKTSKSPSTPKSGSKRPSNALDSPKSTKCEYGLCDIVWAKLDLYPWWPSLVCNDPDLKKHVRGGSVHVQFFDNPPSRSWVKLKLVDKYTGSSGKPTPSTQVTEWRKACEEADKAVSLSLEERGCLIANFKALDGENKENDDGSEDESFGAIEGDTVNSKKGKFFQLDSEDSEDEFKPQKEDLEAESDSEVSVDDNVSEDDIVPEADSDDAESPSPRQEKKRKRSAKDLAVGRGSKKPNLGTPSIPSHVKPATQAKLASFSVAESSPKPKNVSNADGSVVGTETASESWTHLKVEFLKPEKLRDANRRRPDDPDYNPRTLFVPDDFKKSVTPAMRQWWEMKAQYFDSVLFFKVGKFYELYHMDAVIGFKELGLLYMKGDIAHSGFPEIAYGRFSASLIDKGYKVARVEQTETPEMMNERCKTLSKPSKFDKVVKREICAVTTCGTRVFSVQDGEPMDAGTTNYLLAICEEHLETTSTYGVCFIDTSIGTFHIGQFVDDRHCSRLHMLLAHHPPVHVLYERNHLSERTQKLLAGALAAVVKESLASESEFWSASKTLSEISHGNYFTQEGQPHEWPSALKMYISEADTLGLSPADDYQLAVRSLGAITWYLKRCCLDQQLLSMCQFEHYFPIDTQDTAEVKSSTASNLLGRYMVLDGVTLKNLDVLSNKLGDKEGTLLNSLDHCCSPFGKRLLHQWICSPLLTVSSIISRQEAISELLHNGHLVNEARSMFSEVPDLERLLSRIHAQGNATRSKSHPDSRAIFYEDKSYSTKKIMNFICILNGFKKAYKIGCVFQDELKNLRSKLLLQCTCTKNQVPEGCFPDLKDSLDFFEKAFDHEMAQKEGRIIPSAGVDKDYDNAVKDHDAVKEDLEEYLKSQCKHFGCKVVYFGQEKKRFQLEVPEHAAKRAGDQYELVSQKKGAKRFWTPKTKELLAQMMDAEEIKTTLLKDLSRRIFAQFSAKSEVWNSAVQNLAVLDVLMALAEYARKQEGEICVPRVVSSTEIKKPFIRLYDGRHPCLAGETLDSFVPNDTIIGSDENAGVVLVTGPNMGGKSTLMRQAGLLLIMAHMGCHIPAREFEFSPVDRIFTRLGANDDIMAGESTFFVELSETSAILHHATKHSLILIDELGRGTSTYDGTAIASAVVRELATLGARTLFSTHYHTLVEEFKTSPQVTLGHMACMVENDSEDGGEETVTFLYKFSAGACPKSYGFNAARLAGVPQHITRVGRQKAAELEREAEKRRVFRFLCAPSTSTSPSQLAAMLAVL